MKSYLKKFGDTFYTQIKRLIDEAMLQETTKERGIYDAYKTLVGEYLADTSLNRAHFVEFQELITELVTHATEYNEINSKFFGRDYLMIRVATFSNIFFVIYVLLIVCSNFFFCYK